MSPGKAPGVSALLEGLRAVRKDVMDGGGLIAATERASRVHV